MYSYYTKFHTITILAAKRKWGYDVAHSSADLDRDWRGNSYLNSVLGMFLVIGHPPQSDGIVSDLRHIKHYLSKPAREI